MIIIDYGNLAREQRLRTSRKGTLVTTVILHNRTLTKVIKLSRYTETQDTIKRRHNTS